MSLINENSMLVCKLWIDSLARLKALIFKILNLSQSQQSLHCSTYSRLVLFCNVLEQMDASITQNDSNAFVQIALGSVEIDMSEELDKTTVDRMKLEKLKDFLTKSLTFVNSRLVASSKAEVASKSKQGDTLLEIDDVQFFEPRGRFKLIISSESLVLEGKQFSCFADIKNISHISCIPSNATTKKEGEDYLAIRFAKPVKINNKDVQSILGNLSKSPLKMVSSSDGYRDLETLVVCKTLQDASGVKIIKPQKHLFQTMIQQKDFLRCYKGTQEGAIYPLENGVVFVKPLLFLPAEEISSLTAGRGGGAGNTRYIDLRVSSMYFSLLIAYIVL